jgi:hypothetical protein
MAHPRSFPAIAGLHLLTCMFKVDVAPFSYVDRRANVKPKERIKFNNIDFFSLLIISDTIIDKL